MFAIQRYSVTYMVDQVNSDSGYGLNRKTREFRSLREAAEFVRDMRAESTMRYVSIRKLTYEELPPQEMEIFKYMSEVD